jgi:hypothetical protein
VHLAEAQGARRTRGDDLADQILMSNVDLLCDSIELDGPGSAKRVSPEARKKLKGIIAKYAKSAHPFRDCVKDNTKRFGPEMAKHVCGVIKALGKAPTKKVGLAQACPVEAIDQGSFDLLYAISQTAYKTTLGLEA